MQSICEKCFRKRKSSMRRRRFALFCLSRLKHASLVIALLDDAEQSLILLEQTFDSLGILCFDANGYLLCNPKSLLLCPRQKERSQCAFIPQVATLFIIWSFGFATDEAIILSQSIGTEIVFEPVLRTIFEL